MVWLFLLNLFFLWAAVRRKRNVLKWRILFLADLGLICIRPVAETFLRPLEAFYATPSITELKGKGIKRVVVLTGGGYDLRGEMLSFTLPHASMYRFMGGLELCNRLGPACTVVFSGTSGGQNGITTASYMEGLVRILSPGRKVISESRSGSTSEHPINVKPLVGKEPFVLVTSAYHMPRSVKAFRKAGLDPIPYPVDFFVMGHYGWNDLLPSAESLWKIQIGIHEYIGLLYYEVKGYI